MRTLAPDVTEGPRTEILQAVVSCPGIHLRSVERATELPLGQVLYHLDRLERMGLIVSARDAGFRRYYAAHAVARSEKRVLATLRHDVQRHVLLKLLVRSGWSHKELQAALGVAPSTLSFHLQRLLSNGVVARERQGTMNLYSVCEPDLVRRALIYYRESFQDARVDAYVRGELGRLPSAAVGSVQVEVELAS